MRILLFLTALLAITVLVAYFFSNARRGRKKVRPPPRSKKHHLTYQETNGIARLFLATTSLDANIENWAKVLTVLNPENDPQMRTLLLELRQTNTSSPKAVLQTIKEVCINAKSTGRNPSRTELLDEALARLRDASH